MKPVYLFALILTGLCIGSEILFLTLRRRGRHGFGLAFKLLASAGFCTITAAASAGSAFPFAYLVLWGQLLGFAGDALLGTRKLLPHLHTLLFVVGALAFALGHCAYMGAVSHLTPFSAPLVLVIFLLLLYLCVVLAKRTGFDQCSLHTAGLLYVGLEAFLCAMSLAAAVQVQSPGSCLLTGGAMLFLLSDNLLCAHSFGTWKTRLVDALLHATYLGAQLLISWSVFWL